MIIPENKSDEIKEKFEIAIKLHRIAGECVYDIIKSSKRGGSVSIPVLTRVLFENSINQLLIVLETKENGLDRYISYGYFSEYKDYLKLERNNINTYGPIYSDSELSNLKSHYDNYKKKFGNSGDWFGLNLYERCQYLDRKYGHLWGFTKTFEQMYICSYSYLSKSVHCLHRSIDDVQLIKPKFFLGKLEILKTRRDNEVLYLYYVRQFFIANMMAIYYLLDNKKFQFYCKMLMESQGVLIHSFEKREELRIRLGMKKRRG